MRSYDGRRLYSASDLVNFLGCSHASTLDVRQLAEPVDFPDDDAQTKLLQEKGLAHERDYLESLRAQGRSIVEVADAGSVKDRAARTWRQCARASMSSTKAHCCRILGTATRTFF